MVVISSSLFSPSAAAPLSLDEMANALTIADDRDNDEDKGAGKEDELYQQGSDAIDESDWSEALETFSKLAAINGTRADGALYWKAYAEDKLGQRAEALSTLKTLMKGFPRSRWIDDGKALEVEIRQSVGQKASPSSGGDDDLKLIAINSLLSTDPEEALPMLERLLSGSSSPRVKERALFVLSQSGSPRARQIVGEIAKGKGKPDLRRKAIQFLGILGDDANRRLLSEIYESSADIDVKRAVLRSLMVASDKPRLLGVLKNERSTELREEAIQQLGILGARPELAQLYGSETSSEMKRAIIQALFVAGDAERLSGLARGEKDPELRRHAIHHLGLTGSAKATETLLMMYESDKNTRVREAVLEALFVQGNARALIALARKESDPAMRREIVQKLSVMGSKEGNAYLREFLDK